MAKRKKQELTYIFYNPNTDLEAYAEYLTKFFVDIYVKNHKDEIFKMIDELIKQKHACLNETDSIQDETTLITGDIDDIDCSTESKTNKKLENTTKYEISEVEENGFIVTTYRPVISDEEKQR